MSARIETIPPERVWQIHLAGHRALGTHRIDTHDDHVIPEVWRLYRRAVERIGSVATLIEWDARIPPFEVLQEEAERARNVRSGGALPEVTGVDGETVLRCEPGDADALAAAVGRGLDDPELRARVGAAGRERVARLYTWRQTAQRTVEQYREVLAMRRAGGPSSLDRSGPAED